MYLLPIFFIAAALCTMGVPLSWSRVSCVDVYSLLVPITSNEILRAQTTKRKLLPETSINSQVQNLEVHQKFTFPNNTDLLRDFSP
jgi:hypothetical protein